MTARQDAFWAMSLDVAVVKRRALLDAYRAEVLREAAARIRQGWDETRGATSASRVMAFAADLIDPTP